MPKHLRNFRENLLLALDTLRTHKFRSALTVLGVLIGTTTVIGVASIITGLNNQLVKTMEQYGSRSIFIYKFEPGIRFNLTREERMRKPLQYEEAMAIRDNCPDVEDVAVEIFNRGPAVGAKYKGQDMLDANLQGATSEDFFINNSQFVDGRPYTSLEDSHRLNVAVIGADVSTRFFQNEDPIGKDIAVGGNTFRIIGTLAKRLSFLGDNGSDRTVFIPYWTFKKIYPQAKENFILAMAYPNRMDAAMDEITAALRRVRKVKPEQGNNFGMATAASVIKQFNQITGTVALVMVVLSSIGLLVGGIGVMNIMLVSVTERTREIGVRKAIGARRQDITWQFLLEAMTLTGAGGVMGIALGYMLNFAIRTFFPSVPSSVPLWSVLLGFLVSISIGLFFGMWPAMKASRLDPIVALHYE
ncbi:MAG: FtsX-like permease family protein [Acidobacteria bacterium]|nr:MAG: FtsX-like permease family protein [Acidobacteriota bacterium]